MKQLTSCSADRSRFYDARRSDLARQRASPGSVFPTFDQPSFREAVWTTPEASAYVLPPEYNLRFRMAGFANLPITVLHGYPTRADYASIAAALSSKLIHPDVEVVFINGRMFANDDSTAWLFKPRHGVALSLALRMLPDSTREHCAGSRSVCATTDTSLVLSRVNHCDLHDHGGADVGHEAPGRSRHVDCKVRDKDGPSPASRPA